MSEPSQANRWLSAARTNLLGYFGTHTRQRLARGAFGAEWLLPCPGRIHRCFFLLARILGQVGFGEYGMINTTAGMIGGMAGLGIGTTVVKHIAEFKTSYPEKASRILALSSGITWISSLLYAGMVVVLAPWIAARALAARNWGRCCASAPSPWRSWSSTGFRPRR